MNLEVENIQLRSDGMHFGGEIYSTLSVRGFSYDNAISNWQPYIPTNTVRDLPIFLTSCQDQNAITVIVRIRWSLVARGEWPLNL